VALKTGSRNPALLCKAGMIFSSVGDKEGARSYLKQALQSNANIPIALKTNSEHELSKL
jgi:Tfp pilus assembly protein PilF